MKAFSRVLICAVILGLFSIPASVAAYDDDDQPHMQAALEHLRKAKAELELAKHDKGGHRVAAIRSTNEAIRHTELGMKAGDKDEDHDHK
ncbi:MAG TPA: hypothetical protein VEW69_03140 [Alphaproteobacteria bacterium]|nr:hypothetical protein [Alphaproteobacteria bacterium]